MRDFIDAACDAFDSRYFWPAWTVFTVGGLLAFVIAYFCGVLP